MQTQSKRPHVGRNVKTIRFIRGNSQLELAGYLEEKLHRAFSQQLISDIEAREEIEDEELLFWIAEFLKVTPEALQNLDFNTAINVIGSTFKDQAMQPIQSTINQTINPLDKLIELFEKEKSELKGEIQDLRKELSKKKK